MEEWRPVRGSSKYEVSSYGRVKSRHQSLAVHWDKGGYQQISIRLKAGNPKRFSIHRLVAEAFIENPDNLPQVNHIDGNKQNNFVENLEWCTPQGNMQHKVDNDRQARGEAQGAAKLTCQQVCQIRSEYRRYSRMHGATALAAKYDVSNVTILNIINRKGWKHVT